MAVLSCAALLLCSPAVLWADPVGEAGAAWLTLFPQLEALIDLHQREVQQAMTLNNQVKHPQDNLSDLLLHCNIQIKLNQSNYSGHVLTKCHKF